MPYLNRSVLLAVLLFYSVCFPTSSADASLLQDSYVNALQNSQQTDIENNDGPYSYSPPNNNYLPPATYGPPIPAYGPPPPAYGSPHVPIYGPPPIFHKPAPLIPYHTHDYGLLAKLKTKINLFAVGKDMFKDDTSMEEDGMESKNVETEKDLLQKRVNELFDFVTKSISAYDETSR